MCNKIFLLGRVAYIVTKYLIRSIHVRESVLYSSGFRPTWRRRGGRARNRKRFGREPNPESRKIRHVKRAATFSYLTDYLSSFNSIKNRRVKRAEPGIPPVVKSAPLPLPCRRLLFYPPSPPPLRPPPRGTAFRILYDVFRRREGTSRDSESRTDSNGLFPLSINKTGLKS